VDLVVLLHEWPHGLVHQVVVVHRPGYQNNLLVAVQQQGQPLFFQKIVVAGNDQHFVGGGCFAFQPVRVRLASSNIIGKCLIYAHRV